MNSIDDLKNLPEHLRREVLDYAEFLMKKYEASQNGSTFAGSKTVISERFGESRHNKNIESLLSFADNISQKVKKVIIPSRDERNSR